MIRNNKEIFSPWFRQFLSKKMSNAKMKLNQTNKQTKQTREKQWSFQQKKTDMIIIIGKKSIR